VISSSWSPIQFFFIYQIRLFLTNLKLQCNQRSAFDSSHHVKKTKEEGKKKTDVGSFSLQGWRERERVGASDEPHFLFPKYKDQSCALT